MEKGDVFQKPSRGAHVLVISYPLQGHINPMLQFSKRLHSKGLKVTFITTSSLPSQPLSSQTELEFVRIFDGYGEGENVDDTSAKVDHFIASISQSLLELIGHYKQNKTNLDPTPKMVVYDSCMPWVLDVAKKTGLQAAPFFTQNCMVNLIHYHFYKGNFKIPADGSLVSLPGIKETLRSDDLPTFVSSPNTYATIVEIVLNQFSNFEEADCLLMNSVDKLENEVAEWMARQQWPVKTIGPTIPSVYLDKRLPYDKDYGLSFFRPETDICIPWLDARENGSVVYIAMGSVSAPGQDQMDEMASGLEMSNKYFLWVVRASEVNKLPPSFKERTSGKGIIVSWCPQLEVLAHPALGCFVTHCGWNSTLEAISQGVPLVAFPQWTDQPTNAKCIADSWRVGVRVKSNDKGIVTKEEIQFCIQQVMEGEKAKEIKGNASKLKQVLKEAMEEGGSSDNNIEEIAAQLLGS